MCAAISFGSTMRLLADLPLTPSAPRTLRAKSVRRIVLLAALAGFGLTAAAAGNPAAAQSGDHAIIADGEAVVTGFSGAVPLTPAPPGVDPVAVTYIDPAGPSARVIDLRNAGGPPQAQVLPAPKPFTATAEQVGQVFAVALDKAHPANIYLAASSAYGLPIVLPAVDASAPPQRLAEGAPGAKFMPGLFGPDAMQGGPGSIWRIDGASGKVSLFANVTLDGAPNPGPALGGLAFDPASNSLFVADRATGMIHRVGMDGAELGRYDHGVDGRKGASLPPVAFDPAARLDITSPNFHSQDPATWGYASPERRIFGLAAHGGRLYYAVADGLRIWSVAILPSGFGSDARVELQVPPGEAPSEISKIIFDDRGRVILAERGAPTGAFDFQTLAQPATSRALRYRQVQLNAATAPTWQAEPDEYAIGFAAGLRNVNGGVAVGFGYHPDGTLDMGACGGFLWTTGEQLRAAADPDLAAELAKSGPLPLHGLQGNALEAVRPDNVPPMQTYFVNYFDNSGNPAFHGHLGDIAIPRSCGQSAISLPAPVTAITDWPPPAECPPDYFNDNGFCEAPRCPAGHGERIQCCPRRTSPGPNGECTPLRGGNLGCPIGAVPLRRPDGSIQCAWLARCPDGAQPGPRGNCERYCPSGETAWRSRQCCDYGEVGLPNGECCPRRDVHDGKCTRCPEGEVTLAGGECCPRGDVHDGKCTRCPEGEVTLAGGECCPRGDVHDGKCTRCPEGEVTLAGGECCPRGDVHDGKCTRCPQGEVTLPGGVCCPRQDVHDGKCEKACSAGDIRLSDGQCCPRDQVHEGKCGGTGCKPGYHPAQGACVIDCPAGMAPGADNTCHRIIRYQRPVCAPGLTFLHGACVYLHTPRACDPGQVRRADGECVFIRIPHYEYHPHPREYYPEHPDYHPDYPEYHPDRPDYHPYPYRPYHPHGDDGPRPHFPGNRDFPEGHREFHNY